MSWLSVGSVGLKNPNLNTTNIPPTKPATSTVVKPALHRGPGKTIGRISTITRITKSPELIGLRGHLNKV